MVRRSETNELTIINEVVQKQLEAQRFDVAILRQKVKVFRECDEQGGKVSNIPEHMVEPNTHKVTSYNCN